MAEARAGREVGLAPGLGSGSPPHSDVVRAVSGVSVRASVWQRGVDGDVLSGPRWSGFARLSCPDLSCIVSSLEALLYFGSGGWGVGWGVLFCGCWEFPVSRRWVGVRRLE